MPSETSGGLIKRSVSFPPEMLHWLREHARRRGLASVSAVVREAVDALMNAEQAEPARRAS